MESLPKLWYPHTTNPTCPPEIGVADKARPCVRCGLDTVVWWQDQPGHMPGRCSARGDDPVDETPPLRLLRDLEGPYAPKLRGREPYWRPALPKVVWQARVPSAYTWSRKYAGDAVVLDVNGAWIAAATSVEVAHGLLINTGRGAFEGRPGYYQVAVHPWRDKTMPSPIGASRDDKTLWIPEPTMRLLVSLTRQGRWPECEILDSWTGDKVRLRKWAESVRDKRVDAITHHGRDSAQYENLKRAYGEAMSLMIGKEVDRSHRRWECKAARPDWTHAIRAQAAASLWRRADLFRSLLPDGQGPIAVRNVDELVVPVIPDDLKAMIDNTGIKLGDFKIKKTVTL